MPATPQHSPRREQGQYLLTEIMKRQAMTQRDLADEIGLSVQTLSNILIGRGKDIAIGTLDRLTAAARKVAPELLSGSVAVPVVMTLSATQWVRQPELTGALSEIYLPNAACKTPPIAAMIADGHGDIYLPPGAYAVFERFDRKQGGLRTNDLVLVEERWEYKERYTLRRIETGNDGPELGWACAMANAARAFGPPLPTAFGTPWTRRKHGKVTYSATGRLIGFQQFRPLVVKR